MSRDYEEGGRSPGHEGPQSDDAPSHALSRLHPNPAVALKMYRRLQTSRKAAAEAKKAEDAPPDVRGKMETAFGADFSGVRVHQDSDKASGATHAVAEGEDMHFAPGKFAPGSPAGDHLIAHEYAHVVQQRQGTAMPQAFAEGRERGALELDADRAAEAASRGEPARPMLAAAPGVSQKFDTDEQHNATPAPTPNEEASRMCLPDVESRDPQGGSKPPSPESRAAEQQAAAVAASTPAISPSEKKDGPAQQPDPMRATIIKMTRQLDSVYGQINPHGVARAMAEAMTDEQILAVANAPGGEDLLGRMVEQMRTGWENKAEHRQTDRIMHVLVGARSPVHMHLTAEPWRNDPAVQKGLKEGAAKTMSINDASTDVTYDEYSMIMDRMPPGLTPEQFVTEMSQDLNGVVNDWAFDAVNRFNRISHRERPPQVGDIYDIDIVGPFNGSVQLVERTPSSFIFQTVVLDSARFKHPEYGSRQFGFELTDGGKVKFYTRAASHTVIAAVDLVGEIPQSIGWRNLIMGMAKNLESRGGHMLPGSYKSWESRGGHVGK
jgi:Domain of unknown function (DUF4157)